MVLTYRLLKFYDPRPEKIRLAPKKRIPPEGKCPEAMIEIKVKCLAYHYGEKYGERIEAGWSNRE
jgi:hypothetical protein